jgi:hypothetical protein
MFPCTTPLGFFDCQREMNVECRYIQAAMLPNPHLFVVYDVEVFENTHIHTHTHARARACIRTHARMCTRTKHVHMPISILLVDGGGHVFAIMAESNRALI